MAAPATAGSAREAQAEPPKRSKLKRIFLGIAAFLAALAIAYGAGRLQTAGKIDEAEGRADTALNDLHKEHQKVQWLDGRRHLHLSILALEDRNFGIAQNELATAAQLLEQSQANSNEAIAKLVPQMRSQKLIATEDLSVQRQRLLGWARALDAAVP